MLRFFLIPLVLSLSTSLQAAELEDHANGVCSGTLTGQIDRGDAAIVADWIETEYAAQPPAEHPEPVTLCLNSPGGNLAEALKIGQVLYDQSVGTRLEAAATCLSSCALIFMMGTDQYLGHAQGEVIGPRRALHPSARLGFHRPELRLPPSDTRRDDADVERSFNLAIQATLQLVEMANLPTFDGVMIPADLIQAMFTHRGVDFYEIDTTGKAGRWDIAVERLDWPQSMDRLGLFNACNNLVAWQRSYEPSYDPFDVGGLEQAVEMVRGGTAPLYAVNGVYWNYDDMHSCLISMDYEARTIGICGAAPARAVILGESECLSLWDVEMSNSANLSAYELADNPLMFLSPETPVEEAPLQLAEQARRGAAEWGKESDGTGGLRRRCYALQLMAEIRGVQNFATLRAAPGFEHDVLVQLAPGERVSPTDRLVHVMEGADGCKQVCNDATGAFSGMANQGVAQDMTSLNACYEANRYWYMVRAPGGEVGWISGKFLRY